MTVAPFTGWRDLRIWGGRWSLFHRLPTDLYPRDGQLLEADSKRSTWRLDSQLELRMPAQEVLDWDGQPSLLRCPV